MRVEFAIKFSLSNYISLGSQSRLDLKCFHNRALNHTWVRVLCSLSLWEPAPDRTQLPLFALLCGRFPLGRAPLDDHSVLQT